MLFYILIYVLCHTYSHAHSTLDHLRNQVAVDGPLVVAQLNAIIDRHKNDTTSTRQLDTKAHYISNISIKQNNYGILMELRYHDKDTKPMIHPALAGKILRFYAYNIDLRSSRIGDDKPIYGFYCQLATPDSQWQFAEIPLDNNKISAAPVFDYPFNLCFKNTRGQ